MKNKKVLNKKISTEIGVGIIVLVVILIGSLLYLSNKKDTFATTIINKQTQPIKSVTNVNDDSKQQTVNKNDDPFANFSISNFDSWKTYSNKALGIELLYPPELYLSDSNGKITFDYLSPNNPAQKNEGSVLAEFSISSKQETSKQYIIENKLNTLQNFKDDKIQLNNLMADKITYTDAFAGGTLYKTLIQNGNQLIVIDYAGGNKLEDIFNKMLSTVKKI